MSLLDWWEKVMLPTIQFLIGPIVTGFVVYRLTDKRNNEDDKASEINQLDIMKSKLMRVLSLLALYEAEDSKFEDLSLRIKRMESGDFTSINDERLEQEEVSEGVFGDIVEEHYYDRNRVSDKSIEYMTKVLKTFNEIKEAPKNNLPADIRLKIIRIIDELDLNINKADIQGVLKDINEIG